MSKCEGCGDNPAITECMVTGKKLCKDCAQNGTEVFLDE